MTRPSTATTALIGTVALLLASFPLRADAPPRRIVSMNLCTDQMAMLMAAPGQLHSVSHLARDPKSSVLPDEARRFAVNHGLAEEIFMMQPDLVLAGTFTSRASVAMLKRLGFRVEQFPPAYSFDEIREQIRRMGDLLGRTERAEELVAELDRRIAATPEPGESTRRPLAALHFANSYTVGSGTLSSEVVSRAGLENLGTRLGLSGTIRLPLEILVVSTPDLIVGGTRYESSAPALAYQTFEHPALSAVLQGRPMTAVPDKYWVCGAPFTAEAVRILADAAAQLSLRKPVTP
ncbi:ABC transporter substrate-binding protein [Hyphomicrobium sp.]|mgnify:CR=1 FL=1|uniref:ABC transporter substrate-binding protein n=1 Tax=Hyphomicrobium sp. TaxID=82 RepID=UPI002B53236A|nr:ABC transporter substrate-binding protein [Hyphomicrobium sp.]HRN86962.1 ABC transporter substrate-binding protein [Hyphomicrobium sp.]HRQ26684.1 ABC transporter substrate-binding protein [Hyphomicrobium sp.]